MYPQTNPALNATLPEYEKTPQAVWPAASQQRTVNLCDNSILRLALLLALGCSLRIGEILGLTWEHVELSEQGRTNGTTCMLIERELKQCDQSSLEDLEKRGRSIVRLSFPMSNKKLPVKLFWC